MVLFLFLAYIQFIANMETIVVLVLCDMFGSGGANQSDIYPKMLLSSGFPVNPKIMYDVCFARS